MDAIPNLNTHRRGELNELKLSAKKEMLPTARSVRRQYIRERCATMIDGGDKDRDHAYVTLSSVFETHRLTSDFILHLIREDEGHEGEIIAVTVGEILDRPSHYDRMQCLEPLEPEYNGGGAIAQLYLNGVAPIVFSFAHGNTTYHLARQRATVVFRPGEALHNRELLCSTLARIGHIYERGNFAVYVSGDELRAFRTNTAQAELNRFISPVKVVGKKDPQKVPCSIPPDVLSDFLSIDKEGDRNLPRVEGVSSIPCVDTKGQICQKVGYDAEREFLRDSMGWRHVSRPAVRFSLQIRRGPRDGRGGTPDTVYPPLHQNGPWLHV
jgi:hypothetical protein